jgi:hypothetical protein
MCRYLLVLVACCALTVPALSGPNAGGTLVIQNAGLPVSTVDPAASICGQGDIPASCASINPRLDGSGPGDHRIWKVYAAFPASSSPRLMGISFGITYDPDMLVITGEATHMCGDFELPDIGWPGPNLGNSVTWNSVQTSHLVPIYAFSGYALGPTYFFLTNYYGAFGDDAVPAHLDDINGWSTFGFGTDGVVVCPDGPQSGACCLYQSTECVMWSSGACSYPRIFLGGTCAPDPCKVATTISIIADTPDPSEAGQPVTVRVHVDGQGVGTPTGTVTVTDGVDSCTGTVQSGGCVLSLSTPGLRSLVAQYAGDGTFYPSTSPGEPHTVTLPPPTGACCAPDGTCRVTQAGDCLAPRTWLGGTSACSPNPCPLPVPVEHTTWGRIKGRYR